MKPSAGARAPCAAETVPAQSAADRFLIPTSGESDVMPPAGQRDRFRKSRNRPGGLDPPGRYPICSRGNRRSEKAFPSAHGMKRRTQPIMRQEKVAPELRNLLRDQFKEGSRSIEKTCCVNTEIQRAVPVFHGNGRAPFSIQAQRMQCPSGGIVFSDGK